MEYIEFYKNEVKKYKTSGSKRSYLTRERNRNSNEYGELLQIYISNKNSEVGKKAYELLNKNSAIEYLYESCL